MIISEKLPPANSDEALALRFAAEQAHKLRYVAAWGRWLYWTGTHWAFDEDRLAIDLVRQTCRAAAVELGQDPKASSVASARTVAAVERLATSDRRLAARVEQWDADPWLMNTPGGVLDLRTGEMRPHDPDDHMTEITAVPPGGACPRWMRFLNQVTAGDAELQAFMQRMFGYALTGDTSAHALFFLYGTGANGKSVMLDTISGILGAYHCTASVDSFTASTSEKHPTDLARLRGARLVSAVETEQDRRWAESRIKSLTGGDRIAARFMRQDFFEFHPQFKLVVAGNHKPGLRTVDEAIRRRFHMVPFSVTIPKENRDQYLSETLKKTEWAGILRWMVEGCLEWQRIGLAPPEAVRNATEEYLQTEDALGEWIAERCALDVNAWSASADLFASWRSWAEDASEVVGSTKWFAQSLESRGILSHRTNGLRGYKGIRLRAGGAKAPQLRAVGGASDVK